MGLFFLYDFGFGSHHHSYYFFTGNSKSCGLPPECNIHCYVLDVSMPKHSMHCTPDLVTVLPPAVYFTVWCCGRVVDRLTSNRGSVPLMTCLTCAYSFEDLFVVSYGVHGFPEDNLKTNRIPQKKKKKKRKNSTQQLWKWKWKSKCAVAILLDHFSVCCYDVSCRISRIWMVWLFFFFLNGEFMWCITRYITYMECFIEDKIWKVQNILLRNTDYENVAAYLD